MNTPLGDANIVYLTGGKNVLGQTNPQSSFPWMSGDLELIVNSAAGKERKDQCFV